MADQDTIQRNTPLDDNIMKIQSPTLFNVKMGWRHYNGFAAGQRVLTARQSS